MYASVFFWNCERFLELINTLDVGLIQNDANLPSPRRDQHAEVPSLVDDLVVHLEQMRADNTTNPSPMDDHDPPPLATSESLAPLDPLHLQFPLQFL